MAVPHPGIDAYIAKSADFAKPILLHLRAVVRAACPDVEESLKWRHPHFGYRGLMCGMAAFKARATFEALSPSHRREYVEWLVEAKGADTKRRRLETTIEWLTEGKSRNWKYAKC